MMRFLVLLVLSACCCFAETITGVVVGVHDGDTLTLLTAEKEEVKVRLWGIDAPELGQAYGKASKESLSDLAFNKSAGVEEKGKDRYGRVIGVVLVDGKNVNLAQVEAGFAWWYWQYAKRAADLEVAENRARSKGVGLWADKSPVPPWQWRKDEKTK
jgi:micrococcal nuclease